MSGAACCNVATQSKRGEDSLETIFCCQFVATIVLSFILPHTLLHTPQNLSSSAQHYAHDGVHWIALDLLLTVLSFPRWVFF
jgi:hypothetical protein